MRVMMGLSNKNQFGIIVCRRPPMTDKELEITAAAHGMQRLELKDDEVLE